MKPSRLWIYRLLTRWLPETRFFGVKVVFLRWCGAEIGVNVRINSSARFSGNGRLVIGDDTWIGAENFISPVGNAEVRIGSHCDLGPGVMILTGSHAVTPEGCHIAGPGIQSSVTIADGCWLGARSLILPGVSLGAKTIVAAGAVVTSDTVGSNLVAGVPAVPRKTYIQN